MHPLRSVARLTYTSVPSDSAVAFLPARRFACCINRPATCITSALCISLAIIGWYAHSTSSSLLLSYGAKSVKMLESSPALSCFPAGSSELASSQRCDAGHPALPTFVVAAIKEGQQR